MLRRQKKFCLCLCTFNVTFGYMTTANMIKGQMNFHWENEKKNITYYCVVEWVIYYLCSAV